MTLMTSPLDKLTWPRHTARLTLRPAISADAEATSAVLDADPAVHATAGRDATLRTRGQQIPRTPSLSSDLLKRAVAQRSALDDS